MKVIKITKKLVLVFLVLVFSCERYENINEVCTSSYNIPSWDMNAKDFIILVIDDNYVKSADEIIVNIYSDDNEITEFKNYEIIDNLIKLIATSEYKNDNYDDCKIRGEIILIYYY